jgi:hypothetical protein
VRWRRLFGLAPSRPGHPFGVRDLLAALAAYALLFAFAAAFGDRAGFRNPVGTAAGLFAVFALVVVARFVVERRIERQSGVRRR